MRFRLVDAFADRPLAGNPCSVVFGADALSSEQMLAIAREMNQSETAFLMHSDRCDLKARYFTPEREIPLAGHPTIASVHAALAEGALPAGRSEISLELAEGPIRVGISVENQRTWIRMFQRPSKFLSRHDPAKVCALFDLRPEDLMEALPIETVSTGTPFLIIPLRSQDALRRVKMNVERYREYRERSDFFSPHFFVLEGATSRGKTFARHLGTPPDTLEDAFTGSATGCMGAYAWRHELVREKSFIAEQGHWMGRPGEAVVENHGDHVSVAGTAVSVVVGEFLGDSN